ncbi:MAG: 4Fe-4S binding protein [Candidatus Stahlbacteria bacterium]|nr:4Fe-4S binding protein [Candidatus Stahlbacteria bacterium]
MSNFYWKVFKENIPSLVSKGETGDEFVLIPILLVFFIVTAFLVSMGYTKARRIIQSIYLLVLGIIFLQCLCITKQIIWGSKDLFNGSVSLSLAQFWFPIFVIVPVIIWGRQFYCYWICPVGFLQDMTGKANLSKRNKRLSLVILIILLIVIGLIMWLACPSPIIMGAGAWLGLLTIIISILAVQYPDKERVFSKFKYLSLLGWAVLAITKYKVPGPWCVPGQANLKYSAIISFLCVLLVSVVIPRAWCCYICPDGGLLQLISRRSKKLEMGNNPKDGKMKRIGLCLSMVILITIVGIFSLRACDPRERLTIKKKSFETPSAPRQSGAVQVSNETFSNRVLQVATQDTWGLPISVSGISGYNSECHPSLTADGQVIVFNAGVQNGPPYDTLHIGDGFNVYMAKWNGTTWDSIRNVGRHINPATYPTISASGESLFVCKGSKLWVSTWEGTDWSAPIKLPYPVNDSNPAVRDGPCAISIDGRQLYFASNRNSPNVNSSDAETHPAISPDGQRLYFSDFGSGRSAYWKFGDADIYVSHWTGTEWGVAQILPAPVNTDLPSCSAFETSDGRLFLGSHVSEGTYGEEDVWVCHKSKDWRQVSAGKIFSEWQNTGELAGATYIYELVEKAGAIYAATAPNGDVFKTTDGGLTWQNTGDILGETHIYSLLVAQDSSLLAGTYPNGKLFRSTDDGTTWNEVVQFAYARAVREIFQKSDGTLFVGTSPDSNGMGRVWRSTNNGATWQRTAGLPQTESGIFCLYEAVVGHTVHKEYYFRQQIMGLAGIPLV